MGPQIWHTGSTAVAGTDWVPDAPVESPSGLIGPGKPRGQTMDDTAVADAIAAYAAAAADAQRLGFDVVEVHGAHGYLIDQFFWGGTNLRTDGYGGASIKERSRFARDVITAIRKAVGPDFPVILRVSQWKQQDYTARLAQTPAEMTDWLGPLVEAGVDILHCSQRRFWEPEFPEIDGKEGLNFAGWAKKLTGAATISVGSVGLSGDFFSAFAGEGSSPDTLDRLIERMGRDEFDLVAVGRALLSDAQWPTKVRTGDPAMKAFDPASLKELV
jgi:2,4-dienoyl-CoA reductase-like NADH-dependent reductase (Old Yellow Enzyme family)